MTQLKITDTTLRDAHQSLAATRMRTEDMLSLAAEMEKPVSGQLKHGEVQPLTPVFVT